MRGAGRRTGFNGLRNRVNLRPFYLRWSRAAGLDCTASKGWRRASSVCACLADDEHRPCASQTSRHGHWRSGVADAAFPNPGLAFRDGV